MLSIPPGPSMPEHAVLRSRALSGNAFAVASMVFWAIGFPAAELLLQEWHPLALMSLRLLMAMSVLLPLWMLVEGPIALASSNWRRGLWIGALGFGMGTNLLLFAQWYTDPLTVALIATTTPISATIIEVLGGHRRLGKRFLLGLAASVAGGIVAIGGQFSAELGVGVLMAIASGFCFVWASNAAVHDFPDLTPVGRSTITFAGAAVFTLIVFAIAWWLDWVAPPRIDTPRQVALLAVYSVAAMALSQILFVASIARLGVALTSFHINIAPFYVMLVMIALGGSWDWLAALGAGIVGFGVLLSQPRSESR